MLADDSVQVFVIAVQVSISMTTIAFAASTVPAFLRVVSYHVLKKLAMNISSAAVIVRAL